MSIAQLVLEDDNETPYFGGIALDHMGIYGKPRNGDLDLFKAEFIVGQPILKGNVKANVKKILKKHEDLVTNTTETVAEQTTVQAVAGETSDVITETTETTVPSNEVSAKTTPAEADPAKVADTKPVLKAPTKTVTKPGVKKAPTKAATKATATKTTTKKSTAKK